MVAGMNYEIRRSVHLPGQRNYFLHAKRKLPAFYTIHNVWMWFSHENQLGFVVIYMIVGSKHESVEHIATYGKHFYGDSPMPYSFVQVIAMDLTVLSVCQTEAFIKVTITK